MTPADEAHFISLWQQGLTHEAMAQRLGCPVGTVKSRAHTLQQQGKLTPRPRGGRRMPARQDGSGVSADTHRVSRRVSDDTPQKRAENQLRSESMPTRVSVDTPPVQVLPPSQDEMRPLLQDILVELRQLTGALAARVSADTPQVSRDTPGVSAGVSARTPLPAERGKSVRWNLHLSERVRERVKALADTRGLQDSQMVEELLWLALSIVDELPTYHSTHRKG